MIKRFRTELLYFKGINQAKQGNIADSFNTFERALSIDPNYSGIYSQRALCFSKQKKYNLAIEDLKKELLLEPNNPAWYLFLGINYYDFKKFDDALRSFDQSLKISPNNLLTICFRNLVLLAKERL